jgi:hypothetical protein
MNATTPRINPATIPTNATIPFRMKNENNKPLFIPAST